MGAYSSLSEKPKHQKIKLLTVPPALSCHSSSIKALPINPPIHTQQVETLEGERESRMRKMAAPSSSLAALILTLNLFFFTCVSSHYAEPCPPTYKPKPKPKPTPKYPPYIPPYNPPPVPKYPPYIPPYIPPPVPKYPPYIPPYIPPPVPKYPPYNPYPKCPRDTLKLAACGDLLGGLVHLVVGPGSSQCCSLLGGLADVDAAACLCTVIKANVLGINLNIPVSLSLLLNACGRAPPEGFKCA